MNDRTLNAKSRSLHVGSRAARVLADIGKTIEDVHFGLARPGLAVRYGVSGARDYLSRREKYFQDLEIRRLEKKKIIRRKKIANEYWVEFSKKGFEEFLILSAYQADDLPIGQSCLLSFDIPEKHKTLRNYIRRLLKRLGFRQIHRSVWATRKNIGSHMSRIFASKFKDDDWFRVFIASEL